MELDEPNDIFRCAKKRPNGLFKIISDDEFMSAKYFIVKVDSFYAWTYSIEENINHLLLKKERQKTEAITAVKNDAEKKIANLESEVNHLNSLLEKEKTAVAEEKETTEKILKINREITNKERGLHPRKTHTGLTVLQSREKPFSKDSVQATVWETTIQTPYDTSFSSSEITSFLDTMFYTDSKSKENKNEKQVVNNKLLPTIPTVINTPKEEIKTTPDSPLRRIGLEGIYTWAYSKYDYQNHCKKNYILNTRKEKDFRAGFWILTFTHTLELAPVPPEMLP